MENIFEIQEGILAGAGSDKIAELSVKLLDAKKAEQIIVLHNEMLMDFTHKMADLPKQKVYSIQIVKAIDYIFL